MSASTSKENGVKLLDAVIRAQNSGKYVDVSKLKNDYTGWKMYDPAKPKVYEDRVIVAGPVVSNDFNTAKMFTSLAQASWDEWREFGTDDDLADMRERIESRAQEISQQKGQKRKTSPRKAGTRRVASARGTSSRKTSPREEENGAPRASNDLKRAAQKYIDYTHTGDNSAILIASGRAHPDNHEQITYAPTNASPIGMYRSASPRNGSPARSASPRNGSASVRAASPTRSASPRNGSASVRAASPRNGSASVRAASPRNGSATRPSLARPVSPRTASRR